MRNIFVLLFLGLALTLVSSPGSLGAIQTKASDARTDDLQVRWSGQTSTVESQARLLIEINNALVHGSISREQAINLRKAAAAVGEKEDQYLAGGNPLPAATLRQNANDLDAIRAQLERYAQLGPVREVTGSAVLQDQLRSEVDRWLKQGKLSADRARDIRNRVNLICANECWCLTTGTGTMPEKVIQEDIKELRDLDGQLKTNAITAAAS